MTRCGVVTQERISGVCWEEQTGVWMGGVGADYVQECMDWKWM